LWFNLIGRGFPLYAKSSIINLDCNLVSLASRPIEQDGRVDYNDSNAASRVALHQNVFFQPFTPPEVRPVVRCFSININRMITGIVASRAAANKYCHSIMLNEEN